ncbi:MAG TPA: hypothetical protein VG477_17575 [Thermoanaerobaculia bacterium]|nr:hypothetical protein [Thermoanaerobaculia bacterium]
MNHAPRLFLCAALSLAAAATAQQQPAPPPSGGQPSAPPAAQQPSAPAPAQRPSACTDPKFRQFDFWIGSWTVLNPGDQPIGTSEITRIAGGCAIHESWQGGGGGMSLNFFDPADSSWNQVWVGPDGVILRLKGGFQEGAMVLSGDDRKGRNGTVRDRLRWTPQPDGGVLQEWELSADGGKTWQKTFSGRYRKR